MNSDALDKTLLLLIFDFINVTVPTSAGLSLWIIFYIGACSNSRGHFQFAHFHCHLAFLEYFCYYLHYGSVILTHDWYWYAGHNCEKIKLKCYKFKDISRNQGFEFILE